jgi:dolichol kinase
VPVAYALGAPRSLLLPALLALVAVAAVIELARARSEHARERFLRATGVLLRAHEHERLSGATWMLAAFAFAVALYPRDVAVAAMWAVAVGDASAAIVGRLASRRAHRAAAARGEPPPSGKTLAGSAACFAATLAGALGVAALPLAPATVAALAAALAERPGGPVDDNVRVIVTVGAGILLWRMAFS